MATKQLACEEAADYFASKGHANFARSLRAEGRKVVRYERLILIASGLEFRSRHEEAQFEREAARILKARKK